MAMAMIHMCVIGIIKILICSASANARTNNRWASLNRNVFAICEKSDRYILEPLASVYKVVIPPAAQTRIHNFFQNVEDLSNLAIDTFQAMASPRTLI